MTRLEYIKLLNDLRKQNKNKWVNFTENVEGIKIGIKSFNTWVQIIQYSDNLTTISDSGAMDVSVKQWNEFLTHSINNALNRLQ